MTFCPDGIIPDSSLTGLNNTKYIYIYMSFDFFLVEVLDGLCVWVEV